MVPQARREASQGPEKGAVSAQKALQGSETETRELLGGTKEKSISPTRGHRFTLCKSMIFYQKETEKKSDLVARPATLHIASAERKVIEKGN